MKKTKIMFKNQLSFDERKKESVKILAAYSDRVPIIVEKGKTSQLPELDINKLKILP